jgi:alpha-1,6-mannosyltransferase
VIGYVPAKPSSIVTETYSITTVISIQLLDAMPFPTWPFYALIPTFILIHLFVSPYTKVEESFNIQAIHDILVHGIPTENADQFLTANYDHVSFPGSVPRTFAGALVLSGLSRPFLWLMGNMEQVQLLGS